MRLIALELENFRPFQGNQKITFAQDQDQNVTVLYGTNGGGKTTLLNAFTWALYGILGSDLESPDQLINSTLWNSAPNGTLLTASVSVEFEHADRRYITKRVVKATKRSSTQPRPKPELHLWRRETDGRLESLPDARGQISNILPERLSRFFFVNGERIEGLVKRGGEDEVQEAVKTMLGLEAMERAVNHLPRVADKLRRNVKAKGAAQDRLQDLLKELSGTDQELQNQQRRANNARREIKHLDEEVKRLNLLMTQLADAKELQHQRYRLNEDLRRTTLTREAREKEREETVANSGFLSFLPTLPDRIVEVCDALRERGDLPAPLKATFIDDLLERGTCICGTRLMAGSSHRAALETWRPRGGVAEVEGSWNQLKGTVVSIGEQREQMHKSLKEHDEQIADLEEQERRLNSRISEISIELKRMPSEQVVQTEEKLQSVIDARDEKHKDVGAAEAEIKGLEKKRADLTASIDKLSATDAATRRIQTRIGAVDQAAVALSKILDILSHGVRRRLDSRIQNLYNLVSLKSYQPELTSDFELELWDTSTADRLPAPKSTGENMLLSLAFVGSLIGEARDSETPNRNFIKGVSGDFPVVMDAVFGSLDDDYRRAVADFLPQVASQVIILTSKAQAGEVIESQLRPRVGKQYVITTHTTKSDIDATPELVLNGRSYPYQVVGSDRTGAQITEVRD
ncbi:AAA family ATPase [Actinomadura chibensis]|uniref:Nuclease SbcCD subunit C n=1 Tax=Actinomadura chibensis TaxID=392828 RepID=A0A5D0NWZ3_9ACTN|nr:AAA family ATPase [Actinomadura chibensis]TYB49193.1 AAA family ATPase [Actinomadura chibensis]